MFRRAQKKIDPAANQITRAHWHADGHNACEWPGCKVVFSPANLKQNCYACGKCFCGLHVSQKRRLNKDAIPDEAGTPADVCPACYRDAQQLGVMMDLTTDFIDARALHNTTTLLSFGIIAKLANYARVSASTPAQPLSAIFNVFPKRDARVEKFASCQRCGAKFGILTHRHSCTACDAVVCGKCSVKVSFNVQLLNEAQALILSWQEPTSAAGPPPATAPDTDTRDYSTDCCDACAGNVREMQAAALRARLAAKASNQLTAQIFDKTTKCRDIVQRSLPRFMEASDRALQALSSGSNATEAFQVALMELERVEAGMNALKGIATQLAQAKGKTVSEAYLLKGMSAGLSEWLEARSPKFVKRKKHLFAMELQAITDAYTKLFELRIECEERSTLFRQKFGQVYEQMLRVIKDDVLTAVTASGKDWDQYLDVMQEIVDSYRREHKTLLRHVPHTTGRTGGQDMVQDVLTERRVGRECARLLRDILDDLNTRTCEVCCGCEVLFHHGSQNRAMKSKKAIGDVETLIHHTSEQ